MIVKREIQVNIGILSAVAGISCMAIIKAIIGHNIQLLSIVSVILSILLLSKGRRFRYLKTPTADVAIIYGYSIVTLLLCMFSGISIMQNGYGLVYQLAYFIEIYLLWNIPNDFNINIFVKIGFWICGLFSIVALALILRNTSGRLFINSYMSSEGEYIFNRSTIGTLSFVSFSMSMSYRSKHAWEKLVKMFFVIVSIVLIIASSRRSVYLATMMGLLLHFKNYRDTSIKIDKNAIIKKSISIVVLALLLLIAYKKIPNIQEYLDHAWGMLQNGVQTFLGINSSDMSAAMRVSTSSAILDEYLYHSTLTQMIFGRGYMTTWIDIPFLQAFWDMGVIGGVVFIYIQFIIPIKYLLKKALVPGVMAAQYLCALSIFEGIANSFPYGHFFSIVLLVTTTNISYMQSIDERSSRNI